MFERICKKFCLWLGFIAITLLFAVVTLRAHKNVTDEDTLLHIRTGQYIAQNGVPTKEVFSFSIAGQPWIDHQWLWQVIVYTIYKIFGGQGIVALQTFIALTIYIILLFFGYRKDRILLVVGLLFMGMLVDPVRTLIRPDIVSLWFSLVEISILWLFLKKSWSIYLLFILQVLWVNIHGFFIFGPIFVFLIWLAESVKRFIPLPYDWNSAGRLSDDEYHRLLKIGAVLLAACFINPQFINGFLYPLKIIVGDPNESKFMFSYIGELHRPVPNHKILNPHIHPYYKMLIIFSSVGFILNWRRIDLRVFVLWLFFLCFSWGASRNLLFFPPAAYLSIIQNLSHIKLGDIMPMARGKFTLKHTILMGLLVGLIFWISSKGKEMMASQNFDYEAGRFQNAYGQLSTQKYPRNAQKFLTEYNIQGNFFNTLGVGHYLISQNYPNIRVFIDGRTEVYGAEFFKTYQKILEEGDWDAFQQQVDKLSITGIFVSLFSKPIPTKFLQEIYTSPEWQLVYLDYDAIIFLKDIPANKEAISRLKVDLSRWTTKSADSKLLRYPESARIYYNRAVALNNFGFYEKAAGELDEALMIYPTDIQAITLKAKIFQNTGRAAEALDLFELASRYTPNSIQLMMETAFVYESISDYDNMILLSQKMIHQAPKDPRGYFVLSKAFTRKAQYPESYAALEKVYQLDLNAEKILTAVDVLDNQKAYSWTKKACDLVLAKTENVGKICHELDRIHETERAGR